MKITYINPVLDGTGYCVAGISTILALDKTIDTTVRHIKLTGQTVKPPKRINELMDKSVKGTDIVIQHYLPHMMVYQRGFKNVGYFHSETSQFHPSNWPTYLNQMDELWVCSEQNKQAAIKSGVNKPVKIVKIPAIPEIYSVDYPKLDVDFGNRYVFYNVGDWSERKNMIGLIQAYFEEFSRQDNVVLVLKTYREGKTGEESTRFIQEEIRNLKMQMRKHGIDCYPPIILITEYLTNEQIYSLHQRGDCFISLEKGAAWNIPAFDAMWFGNKVIVNGWGGQSQFVKGNGTQLLAYQMESVQNMGHCPYPNVYTCYEQWARPSIEEAKKYMRGFYAMDRGKIDRSEQIKEYSLETVGKELLEII